MFEEKSHFQKMHFFCYFIKTYTHTYNFFKGNIFIYLFFLYWVKWVWEMLRCINLIVAMYINRLFNSIWYLVIRSYQMCVRKYNYVVLKFEHNHHCYETCNMYTCTVIFFWKMFFLLFFMHFFRTVINVVYYGLRYKVLDLIFHVFKY